MKNEVVHIHRFCPSFVKGVEHIKLSKNYFIQRFEIYVKRFRCIFLMSVRFSDLNDKFSEPAQDTRETIANTLKISTGKPTFTQWPVFLFLDEICFKCFSAPRCFVWVNPCLSSQKNDSSFLL